GMAQYAQTVNVIGAIKTTPTAAAFETTGLVLMMYRKWFGDVPVEVSGDTRPVDLAAAWADGGNAFTVAAVNPLGEAQEVRLDLSGVNLADMGTRWRMADADPMAYNDPGNPPKIVIREQGDQAPAGKLVLPPYSVTIWKFPVKK
ncbi:MAG: alpha-N-arabinofuranosidase, partial [Nitrospirae bacterium]|nr:alpha-N-arabinofuranosidase [Fimbriimonadaceae bacterium]